MHGMTHILLYPCLFFVAIKAQKCFTIRLVLFNQNVSMKVMCIFCFLCSIEMNLTYFVVFFPSGALSFLCVQFVVFRLTLWFGLHQSPPHCPRRKNVQVLFHCQFFFRWCFFHDFSQVCLSLRNLPRRFIANLP